MINKNKPHGLNKQQDCSYLTFNVVDWIDVFIRPTYKQIIVDALNFCIESKKFTVYAWVLMTNHLHMLARAHDGSGLSMIEKEFKRVTTTKILEAIDIEPDLRRAWMLQRFENCSLSLKKLEKFQLWQSCTNPSYIDFKQVYKLQERVLYIHENPVRDGIVASPEHYLYSSASDYAGKPGMVKVNVINFEALRLSLLKNGSS
jgi:REP element-mobilizing transposase RayT